jgi:hypothetical protein
MTVGAGAFVEMDAKSSFRRLDLLKVLLRRIKLFLGEKSILQLETWWSILCPRI